MFFYGLFEATVSYIDDKTMTVLGDVSRTNRYKNQSHCVSYKQLKLVLMQPPLFRGHSELTITNLAGTGRWNYLDLDKLKHRKLSLG
jgi:hypothetical protein